MSPAAITHVTDFNHNGVIELAATLRLQVLELFPHLLDSLVLSGILLILTSHSGTSRSIVSLGSANADSNIDIIDLDVLGNVIFVLVVMGDLGYGHVALVLRLSLLRLLLLSLHLLAEVLLLLGGQLFVLLLVETVS